MTASRLPNKALQLTSAGTLGRRMVNWAELIDYPGRPLAELPWPTTTVSEGLRQLSPNAFVFVVPHNRMLELDGRGPYITLAIWAQSQGAARRAADSLIDADEGIESNVPPSELLVDGATTYGELLAAVKRSHSSGPTESAIYDHTGRFVRAQISAANRKFMFRDHRTPNDARPFAIEVRKPRPR